MDTRTFIPLVLSEGEQSLYIDWEFGTTEMDAYKFLSKNMICRYYDWKEGTENLSNIINFIQERVMTLRKVTLTISPYELIKKYSISPFFRHKGGWMQYILSEMSHILQCHQLYLVIWDLLDDGYIILITTRSKALILCEMPLDEGRFYIQEKIF